MEGSIAIVDEAAFRVGVSDVDALTERGGWGRRRGVGDGDAMIDMAGAVAERHGSGKGGAADGAAGFRGGGSG